MTVVTDLRELSVPFVISQRVDFQDLTLCVLAHTFRKVEQSKEVRDKHFSFLVDRNTLLLLLENNGRLKAN